MEEKGSKNLVWDKSGDQEKATPKQNLIMVQATSIPGPEGAAAEIRINNSLIKV